MSLACNSPSAYRSRMSSRPGPLGQHVATELRAELGRQSKSRRWLAEQLGVPHNTLSRWVSGETCPPLDDLDRMCEALGLTMLEVMAAAKYQVDVEEGRRPHPSMLWGGRTPEMLALVA